MRKLVMVFVILWCLPVFAGDNPSTAVEVVLDSFHDAASRADGDLYFSLFAEGAIFMGTDATERWTIAEFKAFAEPYFSKGRGWTYTMTERNVYLASSGKTAWFDESLWNEKYGTCRGTGVLVLRDGDWRIAQYNLTFPIPNDLSAEVTARIKELEEQSAEPSK